MTQEPLLSIQPTSSWTTGRTISVTFGSILLFVSLLCAIINLTCTLSFNVMLVVSALAWGGPVASMSLLVPLYSNQLCLTISKCIFRLVGTSFTSFGAVAVNSDMDERHPRPIPLLIIGLSVAFGIELVKVLSKEAYREGILAQIERQVRTKEELQSKVYKVRILMAVVSIITCLVLLVWSIESSPSLLVIAIAGSLAILSIGLIVPLNHVPLDISDQWNCISKMVMRLLGSASACLSLFVSSPNNGTNESSTSSTDNFHAVIPWCLLGLLVAFSLELFYSMHLKLSQQQQHD